MDSKLQLIDQLIAIGDSFTRRNFCFPNSNYPDKYGGSDSSEWLEWKTRVRNIVSSLMSKSSPAVSMVEQALIVKTRGNELARFDRVKQSLLKALHNTRDVLIEDAYGELKTEISKSTTAHISNRVFIVHGHDSELKTDVERFVHEIGLEPIVLHRQADGGSTAIEKFEEHSDVGYAFILLTPDEVAVTVDQLDLPEDSRKKEYRARPNVIFEFGFFVGRLGRSRVCCLHKGDVAVPSDLSGIVYKKVEGSIDSQAYAIIKDLKKSGYDIRM